MKHSEMNNRNYCEIDEIRRSNSVLYIIRYILLLLTHPLIRNVNSSSPRMIRKLGTRLSTITRRMCK